MGRIKTFVMVLHFIFMTSMKPLNPIRGTPVKNLWTKREVQVPVEAARQAGPEKRSV